MPSQYCNNVELRKWNLGGGDYCNGDFDKCKHSVKIGKQEYCGYCPPRVTLHQVIRGQAGCLWCKYATKKLNCTKCVDCLSQPKRINFVDTRQEGV
jgi:hypothetical protein